MRAFRFLRAATLLLALAGAGCDRPDAPTAPRALAPTAAPSGGLLGSVVGGVLGTVTRLACPTEASRRGTAVVGPEGGALVVDGFRVDFPAGAVPEPETFSLEVVAGQNLEIEVHAEGYAHYLFARPVTVTLDLSTCGGLLPAGLQAWYIDSDTKALLAPMGGLLDPTARTLRFQTPHFSGYTIAW
ncbi:hypothetical protein [Roseisolibacter agri]|uniref:PEGA domain-containing protein n=1 Tax=Roseisolibacter agri TaxID=2014610 RepID=A0AA37QCN6_9BACT|nr:hypothetical protein [Roseisolibacter agri]GLC23865.1 hypothetical protein rosag_03780 [Roseisolibacter agri]